MDVPFPLIYNTSMFSIREVTLYLKTQLLQNYDAREAENIAKIVLEDVFHITNTTSCEFFGENKAAQLADLIDRLQHFEPVQYVTGISWFYGYPFEVNPAVLIPRPETEELVELVIQTIRQQKSQALKLLDIGTGSGCIPISIQKKLPSLEVHALDISPEALEVAKRNAAKNDTHIVFHQADILSESVGSNLPIFDVITSNPPYIPESDKKLMHPNVLLHEPSLALFVPDQEPLLFYHAIAKFAETHLQPNGFMLLECNEFNAAAVAEMLTGNGFSSVEVLNDLQGKERMVRAFHN